MNRTTWLTALALTLAPGATFAQFGGMGGMGGMGMGMGGLGSVEVRRAVQVELEGGRRINGQIDLATVMVHGDLGQFMIHPEKIKMIRFLKPANELKPDDDDEARPAARNNNAQAQAMIMMRRMNPNNAMNMQTAHAKVILHSGEEIIGDIQYGMGFRLEVDYGTMLPAVDKLRTMTFSHVERKTDAAKPDAAKPGQGAPPAAENDRDASATAAPRYFRHVNALLVRPPGGNRIVLYDLESKQALELSGPKDPPLEVTPVHGGNIMALAINGPKITRIAVADNASGWHVQDLKQSVAGRVMPIVTQGIAVYPVGRNVYAYSAEARRWDVADLPESLHATPSVGPAGASIEGQGHIYTFTAKAGQWEHVDVRKIADLARAEN